MPFGIFTRERAIQTAALPWRLTRRGRPEVLLITTRRSGRWGIPKGWPMRGKTLAQAAEQEAFEEAGITGRVHDQPLGSYPHFKQRFITAARYEVAVLVHSMRVDRELEDWPERDQRARKWFPLEEAAELVPSRELRTMILQLGQH